MTSREAYIKTSLKSNTHLFTEAKLFSCVVCTWNVAEKLPKESDSLFEWLHLGSEPDIIAVGMQEIDMSPNAMVTVKTEVSDDWAKILDAQLDNTSKVKYHRLHLAQCVGICLVVYVKKAHATKITQEKDDIVMTGALGGKMGNKGGVGYRFKLFQTTFCFISAHLFPHMKGVEKRNHNFHEICKRIDFGVNGKARPVEEHDYCFFFGDLNYRVGTLDQAIVKSKIKEKAYEYLLTFDQLTVEKLGGRVLFQWIEPPIRFDPTYKYDKGTYDFDTSEKKRTPGWTDRIFYKGKSRDFLTVKYYGKHDLLMSDHRPVSLFSELEVKCIIDYKYREVRDALSNEYDQIRGKMVNEVVTTSEIDLSDENFQFSDVRYGIAQNKVLTLTNMSNFNVEFEFLPYQQGDKYCASWLSISPQAGIMIPRGSCEIKLHLLIEKENALKFSGHGEFSDLLKLRVINGPIYEINVHGNFLRTCFGNRLDELVMWHEPIRTNHPTKLDLVKEGKLEKLFVPKELYWLVNYIYKYGQRDFGLFQESGNIVEVNMIRDKIDNGESLQNYTGNIHSVCEVLVQFLDSLSEGVIPEKYFVDVVDTYAIQAQAVDMLRKLPDENFNVFHYLTSFFRDLIENRDANTLSIDVVAVGFCTLIIRKPPGKTHSQRREDERICAEFLKHFLVSRPVWTKDRFREKGE
jgi:phosphatidylinositol-bisphosphatase